MSPEGILKEETYKLPLSEPPRVGFSGEAAHTPSLPQAGGSLSPTFCPHT